MNKSWTNGTKKDLNGLEYGIKQIKVNEIAAILSFIDCEVYWLILYTLIEQAYTVYSYACTVDGCMYSIMSIHLLHS